MAKKTPNNRRHNPAAYVTRGPDANRAEGWDEEDARVIAEEMARSEDDEKPEIDTSPIRST